MSEFVVDLWMTIKSTNVWQMWPGGFKEGLLDETGVLDDSPLLQMVSAILAEAKTVKRHMLVAADDSVTGDYIVFDSDKVALEDLPMSIVSSASIPLVFPDRKIGDWVLGDGGTVWGINLISAVEKCMELVDHPSKIVMDLAICDDVAISSMDS